MHTYIHTYIHTYLLTYLQMHQPIQPTYLPTYLPIKQGANSSGPLYGGMAGGGGHDQSDFHELMASARSPSVQAYMDHDGGYEGGMYEGMYVGR